MLLLGLVCCLAIGASVARKSYHELSNLHNTNLYVQLYDCLKKDPMEYQHRLVLISLPTARVEHMAPHTLLVPNLPVVHIANNKAHITDPVSATTPNSIRPTQERVHLSSRYSNNLLLVCNPSLACSLSNHLPVFRLDFPAFRLCRRFHLSRFSLRRFRHFCLRHNLTRR